MGFLESAGRSGGIGQLGQGFLSGAIQAGQFTQQAETNEMQKQLLQMKIKEQERLGRPMLLSELVGKGSEKGRPNTMKLFAEAAKIVGGKKIMLPGGGEDYTITPADLPNIQKFMETQKDLHPQIMWAQYQDNQQAIPELQKQLEKAKTPVEQMQITEQIEKLKIESAGILKEFGKEEKAEDVEKAVGSDGKPIFVPKSKAPGMQPYEKPDESTKVRREALEETTRHNRAIEAIQKAKSGGTLGFADKEALRAMGKQLPKSKTAAETAVKNVQKIDRMLNLIDSGAGGVKGELLAKINKVADLVRTTPPEDAKYNTLKAELRGFAGQLRLQLGLIGQTSDRDVAIMYEAAGGMSPAESQKAILEGYKQGYMQDIDNYNSDSKAYSEYSEVAGKTFRPVTAPRREGGPKVVETRTLKNGETWDQYSDGSFKKR